MQTIALSQKDILSGIIFPTLLILVGGYLAFVKKGKIVNGKEQFSGINLMGALLASTGFLILLFMLNKIIK